MKTTTLTLTFHQFLSLIWDHGPFPPKSPRGNYTIHYGRG